MIIVKLTMNARQEKQEEIKQTLLAMIESMSREKGCRNYQVFRNLEDEASFSSVGEWETRDELYQYLRSGKFAVLLGIKSLLSKAMQIHIQTVSRSEGIELVKVIRSKNILIASPKVQRQGINKR